MQEAIELIYRLQVDHGGKLPSGEAIVQIGDWVADAATRAERLWWLVSKGAPPVLTVTYGGKKALDSVLASREAARPEPHWFGGSIVSVISESGPVLPAASYEPYEKLRRWANRMLEDSAFPGE